MNPSIFKAYDIRGIYPTDIDEQAIYNIGRAIVQHFNLKKIAVGKDIRNSSDSMEENLIKGLADQGADVVKIGLATTPLVYFSSSHLAVDAGLMITASHNPAEYNGLKICLKNAIPVGAGSGMEEIKELSLNGVFENADEKGKITEDETIKEKYFSYVAGFYNPTGKKRKLVIDFANAMGIMDKEIYKQFSEELEIVYLFDEYDGNFPNHEANPIKVKTLEALQKKVAAEKADLGIAYDGDGDRICFVAETGEVIPMDYPTALIGKEILKRHPGGLILMDLRSSNVVKEAIEAAGGRVELCRIGHSLIKKQMRETGAIFAGELSGHYFFEENSKAEMTTLAAIMLLNLMAETGKKMSELVKDLKKYAHSGEINSEVADKDAVFEKLKATYKDGKLNEMDGVRIDFDDWWFNVRASNTEPVIRLNLEAKTRELMEEKRDEVLGVIRG